MIVKYEGIGEEAHWTFMFFFSLLVAIGLEAFNKFAQEEKEKIEMEENSEENEEKSKKPKISGRFLLKGVVDMLADTFATTNQWVLGKP